MERVCTLICCWIKWSSSFGAAEAEGEEIRGELEELLKHLFAVLAADTLLACSLEQMTVMA